MLFNVFVVCTECMCPVHNQCQPKLMYGTCYKQTCLIVDIDICGRHLFMSYLIVEPTHYNSKKKVQYRARNIHICDAIMYRTLYSVKKNKGYEELDVCKIIMSHFSVVTLP